MSPQSRPNFTDVIAAADRLLGVAVRTPTLSNYYLDQRTGRRIWLKAESLQHTGSFKFRGAYNRLCQLTPDERARGVIAWSSGNHAQGVALAAQLLGIRARIVMPEDAPDIKRANTLALGAEIVSYDRYSEDRELIARELAGRDGAIIVPSYDDPHIIAGQGTMALELFQDCPVTLDALLVCCSGGGLLAGATLAASGLSPTTALFSVEPEGFDDHARSFRSGQRVSNDGASNSLCDALLAATPGELTFAINRPRVEDGLVVTDDEVRAAIAFAFERLRLVLEPGGAVALAAVLAGKVPPHYQQIGVVLSGGNVDPAVFRDSCHFE